MILGFGIAIDSITSAVIVFNRFRHRRIVVVDVILSASSHYETAMKINAMRLKCNAMPCNKITIESTAQPMLKSPQMTINSHEILDINQLMVKCNKNFQHFLSSFQSFQISFHYSFLRFSIFFSASYSR